MARRRPSRQPGARRRSLAGFVFLAPALALYGWLILGSFGKAIQYSFYEWPGYGPSTFVGLRNYTSIFTSATRLATILHSFQLMFFYTVLTVGLGIGAAVITRHLAARPGMGAFRVIVFLPQVIPLVAAAVGWRWIYSRSGLINQFLDSIGLGGLGRAWLGDPATALPAVGFVGTWAMLGITTMMLTAGIAKIDQGLYEAARLDGAGPWHEFWAVTVPGLRQEIIVCVTMTLIAALASFDIVYMMTGGGPARATMVPGVEIYQLSFAQQRLGASAAMGIVLMALVLIVVIPIQRLASKD